MALTLRLNGLSCAPDAPPSATLLDWLRGPGGCTGVKEGCAEGDCGACTVAVQWPGTPWQAINACLLPLGACDGAAIRTVEGLGGDHPVQRALMDAHGTQCGFCTPGIVMALATGGPWADDDAVHDTLAGNLCRCTGYRPIVAAARTLTPAPLPDETIEAGGMAAFHRPRTLAALVRLRAELPEAWLIGGGTDLGLKFSKGREQPAAIVATQDVAELCAISRDDTHLRIGAAVTYSTALPHIARDFPAFATLLRRLGSVQIRNRGTFAGNLGTASPIGDTLPVLLALDAEVELASVRGSRRLAVDAFITGYRQTVLAADEVIVAIHMPLLQPGEILAVEKISKRFDQDISAVVAAFRLTVTEGHIARLAAAYGGMAATAKRALALEAALTGRAWPDAMDDADTLIAQDFQPLSDHRASAAYRLRVAANLVRRLAHEATGTPARLEAL